MKMAADQIQSLSQEEIAVFENREKLNISINGEEIELGKEDIEIFSEDIPGWQVASEDGITVALDVNLDDELIAEGTARELVNRIQNLRKSTGLNVTDRINASVEEKPLIREAVKRYGDYIMTETLANEVTVMDLLESSAEVEWLDGETI